MPFGVTDRPSPFVPLVMSATPSILISVPRRRWLVAGLVAVVSAAACVSTDDPASPTIPSSLVKVSGDSQKVAHGGALPLPMVVRVLAQNGNPLPGVTVFWARATGDSGKLGDTISTSNAAGEASMTFTAGALADTVRISALLNTIVGQTFTHIVTATSASAMRAFAGDGAVGVAGTLLQLAVIVTDAAGNPIPGVAITWATGPSGGTLSTATATSGSNGVARTALTLGTAKGAYTVTATSPGLPTVTLTVTAI
jgi:Bacterial Ig-like domain (group 1)